MYHCLHSANRPKSSRFPTSHVHRQCCTSVRLANRARGSVDHLVVIYQQRLTNPSFRCLHTRVAFGARTTARDPFHFIDDHSLLYIAGGNLVHFTLSTRTQKFTPATTREAVITSICVTRERHYLAIAERIPARTSPASNASTVGQAPGSVPNEFASVVAGNGRKGRESSVSATPSNGSGASVGTGLSSAVTTMRSVVHIFGLPTYRKRKTISLDEVYPLADKRPKVRSNFVHISVVLHRVIDWTHA
ncbi:hypothetical protein BCR44DRAFT_162903 [Catenaria anguillulae PL171]|uniref:Uncharacterized protein n=1 Tax=Catenaria anguillulae PL171 TaxID=765915 RepID=A0A1Y2H4F0_9FUNG|nr:hypothetical protein BCR44DRAFT_162903 [Catenaria anguillulae PL171]